MMAARIILSAALVSSVGTLAACSDHGASEPAKSDVSTSSKESSPSPPEMMMGPRTVGQIEGIHPSGERVMLDLLEPGPRETIEQMASFIRAAGFECDAVRTANQLQERGLPLDVFKVDCENGRAFQATLMNGRSFIKPWTGHVFAD